MQIIIEDLQKGQVVKIKNQKEFDDIPDDYSGKINIIGDVARVNKSFKNAHIVVSGKATIEHCYGNATIKYCSGNATIKYCYDNATIEHCYDNATIEHCYGNATIKYCSGNATIEHCYDNATIKYCSGNATILMFGFASILALYSAKKIVSKGMNIIRKFGKNKIDIKKSKETTFIHIKETFESKPDFDLYQKLYPVEKKSRKVIMYKAVHKVGGKYVSDYDRDFEYKIGETKTIEADKSNYNSCSHGIHVSHLEWALRFGRFWSDLAILKCSVPVNKIIVCKDCDGKVRTSELKVLG